MEGGRLKETRGKAKTIRMLDCNFSIKVKQYLKAKICYHVSTQSKNLCRTFHISISISKPMKLQHAEENGLENGR